ncbi:MAG: NAD(P)-dependent oxidoreductase [Phycisphaeraceae bacterium]|nr:NAD(P)-dependent oxidoreductase [Phycisphaeraceae bacterium]
MTGTSAGIPTGRRIALIGGAGFIGHHLALALARRGDRVAIVDGLEVNNLLAFAATRDAQTASRHGPVAMILERLDCLEAAGVPIHLQDARDLRGLVATLAELAPQTVVHLAGMSHAVRANREPQAAFDHTLLTLQNTLLARPETVEHVIFLSSSMVYGDFLNGTVAEDDPPHPIGIYGALKLAGEHLLRAHGQVTGLPWTIVRPSALYGPRCVSRRVTQVFTEHAIDGQPLTCDGDGSDRLDFTCIDDLIDGLLRVIDTPASHGETFNLTCGEGRSVGELIGILRERFPGLAVTYRDRDRLMPHRGTLSIERARRVLGYAPMWPLERGIPSLIDWYLARRATDDPVGQIGRGAAHPAVVRRA